MYPASITKILTTMIALEEGNMSDMVEYSHYDVYSLELGAAHISRQEDELLSLKDTLYAVMLASANECANAAGAYIARKTDKYTQRISELESSGQDYDEGKVAIEVFAEIMNERAKKAGATSSNFCNPHGLFNENHYTTCYDMAMITRDAIKLDEFLKIESDTSYVVPATNKNAETHPIANRHKMLFPLNAVYYEGILGGKTGYVDQSGNTLVTFAKRNGMTLISVVMKSNSSNVYNDTKILLDYGFNNFNLTNIAETETKFTFNNSNNNSNLNNVFDSDSTLIELSDEGNIVLPNNVTIEDCTSELIFNNEQSQQNNNLFAHIDYYFNNIKVGGTNLLLGSNKSDFTFGPSKIATAEDTKDKNKYIDINIWVLLAIIVILIVIVGMIYYSRFIPNFRRNRRHRRRRNKVKYNKKNHFRRR
jgi:D-alanyl-D-alanine carboxypeptidase